MTIDARSRDLPGTMRHRIAATAVALTISGGALIGMAVPGIAQQDGTGAATPAPPTNCAVVDASGSLAMTTPEPTTTPDASPQASPVASPVVELPVASPIIASPVAATPVASPVAETPADPLAADLEEITNALFGCLNERNFETYASLTSDVWRGSMFGSSQRLPVDQFVALAQSLPDADNRLVSISNVERIDIDTAHAEVTWVSAYQQRTATWIFQQKEVDGVETWVLYSQTLLPVETPVGAYVIDVTIEDNGYSLDPASANGSELVLDITNPTDEDHEALVVRLDEGVAPEVLLQGGGEGFPEGVTLVGQSTVPAGARGTMLLVDLPAGTYTIVDLFPDETGAPNLASGMMTTFTVND